MTKMVVRLSGPGIAPGSFAALPKTIFRAEDRYARIEDPPDAKQHLQKLTIIAGTEAYSINLTDHSGTHATNHGNSRDLHLPIVLPFDPKHQLGRLDQIEFGAENEFFEAAKAIKVPGPTINAKPTDAFELPAAEGSAQLVVRRATNNPIFLKWRTPEGLFQYEYITYEDVPFDKSLFAKPGGVRWREIPADPAAGASGQ